MSINHKMQILTVVAATALLLGQGAYAQSMDQMQMPMGDGQMGMTHVEGMNHSSSMQYRGAMGYGPTEPGQGAFAAIAEIVAMLADDPNTDWTKVNIAALRQHLLDMDNLVSFAIVRQNNVPGGLEMTIELSGQGAGAASRMVPAHSPVLATETGWAVSLKDTADSLIWTVTSPNNVDQIRALGFFGLMAVGDHHQPHHLGMATGQMVH